MAKLVAAKDAAPVLGLCGFYAWTNTQGRDGTEAIKSFFLKIGEFLGLKKNTKYVNDYIHRANIHSGIYLAAVVAILEIWLVCRQHGKYIIPITESGQNYFDTLFRYTSIFWLLMFHSFAMFAYCHFYLAEKKEQWALIVVLATSGIGLLLCAFLPKESAIVRFNQAKVVETVLLIVLYASIALFHIATIVSSIMLYRGKKVDWLSSITVITIYASCLLIFGIRVSYTDFFSSAEEKQIICFLTMVIYVACLLVWKPYVSVSVLGAIFLGFYFLLESRSETRVLPDGDKVNYLTFFISLAMVSFSIHRQRTLEASKDEELELLATKDKLTGLYSFEYFLTLCQRSITLENPGQGAYIFLFLDVSSFSLYTEQRGHEKGNEFLRQVGQILLEEFPDGIVCRQGDDNYAIYTKNSDIEQHVLNVKQRVQTIDSDIRLGIKVGGYCIRESNVGPRLAVERARSACATVKQRGGEDYALYDETLREKRKLVQYIVSHVDEAIESGWIKAYYQPVVYASNRKFCGAEALTRWIDPKHGFMPPGMFISTLEDARLAYKLDLAMLEIVCKNMAELRQNNRPIFPVSINFSRADFALIDVPSEVKQIVEKYGVDPKMIHVEITESALISADADLHEAMKRLKTYGFEIWLDDFGSGYSSFNALKDYSFDVLKLDMEFLKGFESNEKSKPLITSVVNMAGPIGMATLAEGVETEEQAAFLKSIGCGKLQGYLISKPIPFEDLLHGIDDGRFILAEDVQ